MKKKEVIENIIINLKKNGSTFADEEKLLNDELNYINDDSNLNDVIERISADIEENTFEFLNEKNNDDINFISSISSCIYIPSVNGDLKIKFIGGNVGRDIKLEVDENTMFDIASITKLFTLILAYECENLGFNLDLQVSTYLPEYKLEDFTFNDLIRLCGELYTDGNIALASSKEEAFNILKTLHLKDNFKDKNKYTDFGAIVIGEALTKFLNETYNKNYNFANWMDYMIFKPLEMQKTKFNPNTLNISGNNGKKYVHDPKARILGGAVGSAGIFTTSDDLCKLAENLFSVDYLNYPKISKLSNLCLIKNQLPRFGEVTFKDSVQSSKGNLGLYVKHKDGFLKTYTPNEFATGSFSHQGYTGAVAIFDPRNYIHENILTNSIYETLNKELIKSDKPIGYGDAFVTYLTQFTTNCMLMYVAKKYYNDYLKDKTKIDITKTI